MSAEVIPLTKALFEYYAREREPRFRPVNGVEEERPAFWDEMCEEQKWFWAWRRQQEQQPLTSDNLCLTTIRPWRPEDDDGGNAA